MRRTLIATAACLLATFTVGTATAGAATIQLVQGEQLVTVKRLGTTLDHAMRALMRGPTAAERRRQTRSYILPRTPVRSITVAGSVATIDFNTRLVQGDAPDVLLARLAQVVGTATGVPGIRSVRILILGGTPLGLFPGVDARVPLTPAMLATPDIAPTPPPSGPSGGATDGTRQLQQRLADLGYMGPSGTDGRPGPATTAAIIAFQKWQGLGRDGVAGPQTLAALATATRPTPIATGPTGRRIEILIDRQLVLAIENNVVVRAVHTSTGKASTPTTIGTFSVYGKFPRWWSTPFREWLLWAAPFVGGIAMHQYPDVPVYPASHGCVRLPAADAQWMFNFVAVGTPVRVLANSR